MSFNPIKPMKKTQRSAYAQNSLKPIAPVQPSQKLQPAPYQPASLKKTYGKKPKGTL